jgi:hypothetical protein
MSNESPALCECGIDFVELQARIYTDLQILAENQVDEVITVNEEDLEPAVLGAGGGLSPMPTSISEFARQEEELTAELAAAGSAEAYAEGTAITEQDPGDENDYQEPSSASR